MKITLKDLYRWKEDSLCTARQMNLNLGILTRLDSTELVVFGGGLKSCLYGWAHSDPLRVEVYQENPAQHFPRHLWEMWNQSGMDHELIGHLYNYHADLPSDEKAAGNRQREMAQFRGRNKKSWKLVAISEPWISALRGVK